MIVDVSALADGDVRDADVAIIGCGPAGLTLADELTAAGVRVALLDAGSTQFTRHVNRYLRGRSTGVPFPLVPTRARGFGGTSIRWRESTGLRTRPLDDVDFESSDARPGTQWPFGRDELDPYYARASIRIGLSDRYDTAAWYPHGPASPLGGNNGELLAYFQFADDDVFTGRYLEIARSSKVDLMLDSTVVGIDQSTSGAVERLRVLGPSGQSYFVRARVYALAAGAIENSRVLLESPGASGRGVGNEHDLVGRYFMDHISVDSGVIVPNRPLDVSAFLQHQSPTGLKFQPMLWLGSQAICEHRLLNAAFWVNRIDAAYLSQGVDALRSLRNGFRVTPRLPRAATHFRRSLGGAADIVRFASGRFGSRSEARRVIALRILSEQVPDRESRVTLADRRDPAGRRRVALDWRINDVDRQMIRHHQDLLADVIERHNLGTVVDRLDLDVPMPFTMSNHHHLGGTRMHNNKRAGVVDAEGRVHTAPNLFVTGGSVFPAGGYLNPTLTIIALAMRLAETIARELRPVDLRSSENAAGRDEPMPPE